MSKFKIVARQGFAPLCKKVSDIQRVNDIGGIISNVRYGLAADPCKQKTGEEEKMDIKCKVALVTGGACGIGFAVANELLNEGLYRVIIGDLDPCRGMKAADNLAARHGENKCCYAPLNVACKSQLEDVMKKIQAKFGNLDILINNAGVISDDIDLELDTNLRPIIHGTEIAYNLMRSQKHKGGVIINIGDTKGLTACKYFPVYAAEKSGVHKYSMGKGRNTYAKSKVRVVALAPGLTETDMGGEFQNRPDPPCLQQRACVVGKAVTHTVRYADSGTLWVIENRKLYKVNWPSKNCFLQLITII